MYIYLQQKLIYGCKKLLEETKGAKKEFSGLKSLLIFIFVFITLWYLRGSSSDDRHLISTAKERKGLKSWFKGAHKEFRWFRVVLKGIIISPDKYKIIQDKSFRLFRIDYVIQSFLLPLKVPHIC